MKLSKQILEAINRGIQLALDDIEDIDNKSVFSDVIDSKDVIKNRIEYEKAKKIFNDIIDKWDSGKYLFTKNDLKTLAKLSKQYGFKYIGLDDSIYIVNETIDLITQVDPKADLNWIDMSRITNLNEVFAHGNATKFNGDISKWDVSNVESMDSTFMNSEFNGDISNWNTTNVQKMGDMFSNSRFNGDIANWDVSHVTTMHSMFCQNKDFNQNISKWDVSNVNTFESMFQGASHFNKNISNWKIKDNAKTAYMFDQCKISPWNKPKALQRF